MVFHLYFSFTLKKSGRVIEIRARGETIREGSADSVLRKFQVKVFWPKGAKFLVTKIFVMVAKS